MILNWLIKQSSREKQAMSEQTETQTTNDQPCTKLDWYEIKLKQLVKVVGAQTPAVFDDLCKIAKQIT